MCYLVGNVGEDKDSGFFSGVTTLGGRGEAGQKTFGV